MSPRSYNAGERRLAARNATRAKIIEAARTLLTDDNERVFSIDAVAARADVARMTVYYQFKSKAKLLEALFDDFAERANMRQMRKVFEEGDPLKSLHLLIDIFCNAWSKEAALLRRLTALAALDPEIQSALRERGSWRREALVELVRRFPKRKTAGDLVTMLHALTSFEMYEALCAQQEARTIPALLKRSASALVESL
jgi:AcrR family transcriptional regulator